MADTELAESNLRNYLQVFVRRWLWIVAVTILAAAIGAAYVKVEKKQYAATAQLLVQPAGGSASALISGNQPNVTPSDLATQLALAKSVPVKATAASKLGFEPNVSATELGQSDVINLTATEATPELAAHTANIYATAFVDHQRSIAVQQLTAAKTSYQDQINAIDSQIRAIQAQPSQQSTVSALEVQEGVLKEDLAQLQVASAQGPGGVEIVSSATPPSSPSSPKVARDVGIAVAVGLIVGIIAAFAAEHLDVGIRTKDQAEQLSGMRVLAMVPRLRTMHKRRRPVLITKAAPYSRASESYRSLRTALQFAGLNHDLKTILVTSPTGGNGKSSTVANLATVLATAGARVVVVNGDLRRARLNSFFRRPEDPGIASVLLGRCELEEALLPVHGIPGLTLLGTGPIPPNPTELLGSERTADIFAQLADNFDVVLIDSPPLIAVSDALVLSGYADGVLLVLAVGESQHADVERAVELLHQVHAKAIGVVLNKTVRRSGRATDAGYRYGYGARSRRFLRTQPELVLDGHGLKPADLTSRRRGSASA
jgi:capsular exopolysaccharide synthesis family protein